MFAQVIINYYPWLRTPPLIGKSSAVSVSWNVRRPARLVVCCYAPGTTARSLLLYLLIFSSRKQNLVWSYTFLSCRFLLLFYFSQVVSVSFDPCIANCDGWCLPSVSAPVRYNLVTSSGSVNHYNHIVYHQFRCNTYFRRRQLQPHEEDWFPHHSFTVSFSLIFILILLYIPNKSDRWSCRLGKRYYCM